MADQEQVLILLQGFQYWNQWRDANPRITPDFSRANLMNASLGQANLAGANFEGALLNGASFWAGVLRDANFENAQLEGVNFFRAFLSKANFRGANLVQATFNGGILQGANFGGAWLGLTTFIDVDLRDVKGLETVDHLGPSSIGVDTIYRSKGKIPDVFLRGCGFSENFITHMQSLVAGEEPIQFFSCFISYSHADKSFARRLHDGLQGRGIRCWLDEHQVLPGQKIYTEVDRGIRLWDKVLLCCSKEALKSWWVENEIQIAFEKEQQLRKQRGGEDVLALIPLDLDGYLFTDECDSGVRAQIRARLAADFTGWETDNSKFEAAFEKLVRALRADAGGRELPPQPRL